MPERQITHEQRSEIMHHLSYRRYQHFDTLRLDGHSGYEEGYGQVVDIDGQPEAIILMSRYNPVTRVRQNYVVAGQMGLEWLERRAFIDLEVSPDLSASAISAH